MTDNSAVLSRFPEPKEENDYLEGHADLLIRSFGRLTGRPLIVSPPFQTPLAKSLFYAPFALVSHDTSSDPIFTYANQTALHLFEMTWEQFTTMPSRYSAEPDLREDREALLRQVHDHGYIDHYSGIRVARSGRRFRIFRAVVWNLLDDKGIYHGQAACFHEWEYV